MEYVKSSGTTLKVGVLDPGPGYFARLYFRQLGIPVEVSYFDRFPTGGSLMENNDIQALVGSAISDRPANVVQFEESLGVTFPSNVPTAYGYLAFTAPILDGDEAAALERILKDAVQDEIYRKRLEERGLRGIFTDPVTAHPMFASV